MRPANSSNPQNTWNSDNAGVVEIGNGTFRNSKLEHPAASVA
jgi:hypothetical protein